MNLLPYGGWKPTGKGFVPSSKTLVQPHMSVRRSNCTCGCGFSGTEGQVRMRHGIPDSRQPVTTDKRKDDYVWCLIPQGRNQG